MQDVEQPTNGHLDDTEACRDKSATSGALGGAATALCATEAHRDKSATSGARGGAATAPGATLRLTGTCLQPVEDLVAQQQHQAPL